MGDKKQILNHPGLPRLNGTDSGNGTFDSPCEAVTPPRPLPVLKPTDSGMCRDCLAAIAHRLAQPITALRGGIELGLMGKRTASDYRSILEESLKLADRLVEMIVSLRDLGESLGPTGPGDCVNLRDVLEDTVREIKDLAEEQNVRLEVEPGGPANSIANPTRLRDALLGLLTWVIQNSAGGGTFAVNLSLADGTATLLLRPPRLDLQYLQIRMLNDIATPGVLFSSAAKSGGLSWAIHLRAIEALGGKLQLLIDGLENGAICVSLPLAPAE